MFFVCLCVCVVRSFFHWLADWLAGLLINWSDDWLMFACVLCVCVCVCVFVCVCWGRGMVVGEGWGGNGGVEIVAFLFVF